MSENSIKINRILTMTKKRSSKKFISWKVEGDLSKLQRELMNAARKKKKQRKDRKKVIDRKILLSLV